MVESAEGNTTQHRRDKEVYNAQKKKNYTTHITLFSSMENDIMREYRKYELAHEMWNAFKKQFGVTSIAKVRQLTIKFDTYKNHLKPLKSQHEVTSSRDDQYGQ